MRSGRHAAVTVQLLGAVGPGRLFLEYKEKIA